MPDAFAAAALNYNEPTDSFLRNDAANPQTSDRRDAEERGRGVVFPWAVEDEAAESWFWHALPDGGRGYGGRGYGYGGGGGGGGHDDAAAAEDADAECPGRLSDDEEECGALLAKESLVVTLLPCGCALCALCSFQLFSSSMGRVDACPVCGVSVSEVEQMTTQHHRPRRRAKRSRKAAAAGASASASAPKPEPATTIRQLWFESHRPRLSPVAPRLLNRLNAVRCVERAEGVRAEGVGESPLMWIAIATEADLGVCDRRQHQQPHLTGWNDLAELVLSEDGAVALTTLLQSNSAPPAVAEQPALAFAAHFGALLHTHVVRSRSLEQRPAAMSLNDLFEQGLASEDLLYRLVYALASGDASQTGPHADSDQRVGTWRAPLAQGPNALDACAGQPSSLSPHHALHPPHAGRGRRARRREPATEDREPERRHEPGAKLGCALGQRLGRFREPKALPLRDLRERTLHPAVFVGRGRTRARS